MDSVIKTLYWCDVANKFFYLSGSIAFIFSVICIGTDFMPSQLAQKRIIEAKIATALADNSLFQPEREYLQSLAASYALKSEVAEK